MCDQLFSRELWALWGAGVGLSAAMYSLAPIPATHLAMRLLIRGGADGCCGGSAVGV